MPIPVTIPSGPLSITDAENLEAEEFLAAMAQVMEYGTTGSTITTPPILLPVPGSNPPTTAPFIMSTAASQLFYRQIAIAMAASGIGGGGGSTTFQRIAQNSLTLGCGVYYSANNEVSPGDCSDIDKCGIIGISNGIYAALAEATLLSAGVILGALSAAAPGTAYYMGTSGQPILDSALVSGQRIIRLGYAKNATDLEVSIQDIGMEP